MLYKMTFSYVYARVGNWSILKMLYFCIEFYNKHPLLSQTDVRTLF